MSEKNNPSMCERITMKIPYANLDGGVNGFSVVDPTKLASVLEEMEKKVEELQHKDIVDYTNKTTEFSTPTDVQEPSERTQVLNEAIEKIEKVKQGVRKQNGTFKYDSCYDDCITICNRLKTNK